MHYALRRAFHTNLPKVGQKGREEKLKLNNIVKKRESSTGWTEASDGSGRQRCDSQPFTETAPSMELQKLSTRHLLYHSSCLIKKTHQVIENRIISPSNVHLVLVLAKYKLLEFHDGKRHLKETYSTPIHPKTEISYKVRQKSKSDNKCWCFFSWTATQCDILSYFEGLSISKKHAMRLHYLINYLQSLLLAWVSVRASSNLFNLYLKWITDLRQRLFSCRDLLCVRHTKTSLPVHHPLELISLLHPQWAAQNGGARFNSWRNHNNGVIKLNTASLWGIFVLK